MGEAYINALECHLKQAESRIKELETQIIVSELTYQGWVNRCKQAEDRIKELENKNKGLEMEDEVRDSLKSISTIVLFTTDLGMGGNKLSPEALKNICIAINEGVKFFESRGEKYEWTPDEPKPKGYKVFLKRAWMEENKVYGDIEIETVN